MASGTSTYQYWQDAARPRLQGIVDVQPLSDAKAVAEARKTVDEELEAIRLLLSTVMMHRNALAITSSLPAELLSRVFEFHAMAHPPAQLHYSYGVPSDPLGWITVSHVCRFWRQVALGHPRLWKRIAFDLGPRWTERMLNRAKGYPIIIEKTFDARLSSSPEQSLITHHMYHIKELNLRAPPQTIDSIILSLEIPAPVLQVLSLAAAYPLVRRARQTTHSSLPSSFLSDHAPQLRRITLHGCIFPWQAVPTNGCQITSLDITFPGRDPVGIVDDAVASTVPDTYTLNRVLQSLARMPFLESLVLHGCLPSQVGTLEADSSIVSLLRLVRLSLSGLAQSCLNLLKSLRISPLAKLAINCSSCNAEGVNHFFSVLNLVTTHLSSPERTPLHVLNFTSGSILPDIMATAWSQRPSYEDYSDRSFVPPPDPDLDLQFESSRHPLMLSSIAQAMCRAIPRMNLRRFSIGFLDSEWTASTWAEVFSVATDVTMVQTHGVASMEFCKALSPRSGKPRSKGGKGRRGRPLFLPKLESLSLVEVDFRAAFKSRPFHKSLVEWLQRRKQAGGALKELDIEYCTIEHAYIGELEKAVPTVTWDGQKGDLETDDYYDYSDDEVDYYSDDYDAYF